MKVYIASSWKNQHAVELVTEWLRSRGHEVVSFVENNPGENPNGGKPLPFDEWCSSPDGERSFVYDTNGATKSDLVIYIGPSGCDAWAEVGAAWAAGRPIVALYAKGEQVGLMRRMATWVHDIRELRRAVEIYETSKPEPQPEPPAKRYPRVFHPRDISSTTADRIVREPGGVAEWADGSTQVFISNHETDEWLEQSGLFVETFDHHESEVSG